MSKAEVMLIMILFHDSSYRCFIETMNEELKNIVQVEYSKHRCFDNFIVNLLGAIAAYCLFPKNPCINEQWSKRLVLRHRTNSQESPFESKDYSLSILSSSRSIR